MNYILPSLFGLFLIFIVFGYSYFPKWLKWTMGVYYVITILLFGKLRTSLADKWYVNTPVSSDYWDANSTLTDIFTGVFFIPVFLLFLFMYYNWFKSAKNKLQRVCLGLSIFPVLCLGLVILFGFELIYGYQP